MVVRTLGNSWRSAVDGVCSRGEHHGDAGAPACASGLDAGQYAGGAQPLADAAAEGEQERVAEPPGRVVRRDRCVEHGAHGVERQGGEEGEDVVHIGLVAQHDASR
ncbi:MAG: hypothetical protein R2746_04050 [Acidimicrobiales bacterium]